MHFRYQDARPHERDLLDGMDLVLRPGETMALVGITGSGKTTLTTLPTRLYDVTGGRVALDGVDVRDLTLAELRTHIAMAFEDATLFSASVRENVLLGRADLDVHSPEAERVLREALEVAQAGFVDTLPEGVETLIGEEGLSLSGGQRQRLALARAVAAKPKVLVLDDPLSALDVDTEALVEEALRHVLAETTALIVAHRPSTVALADRVALLQDGRVTAVGTHSELLRTSAHYRHVISSLEAEEAARTGAIPIVPDPSHPHPRTDPRGGAGMSVDGTPQGTKDEDRSNLTREESAAIRRRSLRLFGSLVSPLRGADRAHRTGAGHLHGRPGAGPALVAYGLNNGAAGRAAARGLDADPHGRDRVPHGRAIAGSAFIGWYAVLTARITQAVLIDLRKRMFLHTQRLSLEFHESYTSGRIISRQTSDLDSIRELLDGGLNQLVSGLLYGLFTFIALVLVDWESGVVLVLAGHPAGVPDALVLRALAAGVPRVAGDQRQGDRAVRGDDDRHPRREGVPQGAAQRRRRSSKVAGEYRDVNRRSMLLFGTFEPGLMAVGRAHARRGRGVGRRADGGRGRSRSASCWRRCCTCATSSRPCRRSRCS